MAKSSQLDSVSAGSSLPSPRATILSASSGSSGCSVNPFLQPSHPLLGSVSGYSDYMLGCAAKSRDLPHSGFVRNLFKNICCSINCCSGMTSGTTR